MAKKQSQEPNPFPRTACGQCCRRVYLSELTAYLYRGDGICVILMKHQSHAPSITNAPWSAVWKIITKIT